MKIFLSCALCCLTFFVSSCGTKEAPTEEAAAITKVIKEQQQALLRGNSSKIRATSAGTDQQWHLESVVQQGYIGDYHTSVKESKVISYTDKKAVVEVLIYQRATGRDESDQQYLSSRTVVKVDGKWKVSKIQDQEATIVTE